MGTEIVEKIIILPEDNSKTIKVNEVGSQDIIIVYTNTKLIGYIYCYSNVDENYWELNTIYDRVSDDSLISLMNIYPDYTFKVLINEEV